MVNKGKGLSVQFSRYFEKMTDKTLYFYSSGGRARQMPSQPGFFTNKNNCDL